MFGKKRKQSFRFLALFLSLMMMLENTAGLALASDSGSFQGFVISNDVPRQETPPAPPTEGEEPVEEPSAEPSAEPAEEPAAEPAEVSTEDPTGESSENAAGETEMKDRETEAPVLYQVFFASEGAETIMVSVPEGEALGSLPNAPQQDDMRFTGWYTKDGTSVDESFVPVEDVTVTAHFVKDWTVTYMDETLGLWPPVAKS